MRKFFNSKESQQIQLEKNRLQAKRLRRIKRLEVEKKCQTEINRISAVDKLSELLASKVSKV